MQDYKEVCGNKECVWFEIEPSEGVEFLKWAKKSGCVWLDGEEIQPEKGAEFFHFSTRNDGTVAYVAMFVWFAKHPKFENVDRYVFSKYVKGVKAKPQSRALENTVE